MRYREVIRMPLWLLALIYFFFLSFVLSVWAALGNSAALVTFLALSALLVLISIRTRLIIQVDHSELMVGKAHIELKYIGQVTQLDSAAMKAIRSRDANPMAFLAFRFWSSTGVKVEVIDDRDETPYWLITSNKANQLAKALREN
jgi:ABC-type histidine transport system ATPase subunit